ncbi:MAG TPA: hypothetical protein ENN80_01235, partial [Candidatus Hydrogenedentes bacterium]|nr:hypothetical protein [Candidatus Hydrogenedentota bacterium]
MLTALCLSALASLGANALSEDERSSIGECLGRQVLAEGATREDLVRFVIKRLPPLVLPASAEAWTKEGVALRKAILERVIFRGVPEAWRDGAPAVEWTDVIETDHGYRIRKLRYEALPGLWIPALLYEPDELNEGVPGVLNVNGHEYAAGKAVKYEQLRCINLTKRGIVNLHPEWLNCGELHKPCYDHNTLAYLNLCGISGVGVFHLAMQRGLDVLAAHGGVDPERLAMTGLSGGGWQTIILSALDTRIAVSIPNAGYIGLDVRTGHLGDVGDLEQIPVDLASIADYPHLTALLAPRPALLLYNEQDDCCFQSWRAQPSVYDPVKPFYALYGKQEDFAFHNNLDPGTHNYDQDNREQCYRFLNRHFLPQSRWIDDEIPSDTEIRTVQKLTVGVPKDNASFYSLAEHAMAGLPETAAPDLASEGFAAWQEDARSRLAGLLRLSEVHYEASLQDKATQAGPEAAWYELKVNEAWRVPVLVLSRQDTE